VKIALIAPPFISVPPKKYGGTELFVAHLAEGLVDRGHEVIVYANGESTVRCELRWLFPRAQWPLQSVNDGTLRNLHHSAWALKDADDAHVEVVHLNDASAVPLTRFLRTPAVHTLHHPHEAELSEIYMAHPQVFYIAISDRQRQRERMRHMRTIHHGIRLSDYRYSEDKHGYLSFLGRIAPIKGVHTAIAVARRAGIPLKIAGEIQPQFKPYWESAVLPHVDGRLVEYVGEATPDIKNDLLAHSNALLFPIEWEEPFGLVMLEAMACGTPVIALPGGAVREVVQNGVSGWICRDVDELAARAVNPAVAPRSCRAYVERHFSVERMVECYERVYQEVSTAALVEQTCQTS
jgi:glycosyltransferase involved in cell wall biosynthesis